MSDLPSIHRRERPTIPPDYPAHLSAFISVEPPELKTVLSFLKSANSCGSARVRFSHVHILVHPHKALHLKNTPMMVLKLEVATSNAMAKAGK